MMPPNSKTKNSNMCNNITDNRQMEFIRNKGTSRREAGDRFIPRRLNMDIDAANFYINCKEETKDLFSQDPKEPSNLWYNRVGSMYPPSNHVYSFSTQQKKDGRKNMNRTEVYDPWPIRRSELLNRPGSLRPDHVYDLPTFRNNFYINAIDWSSSGYFGASLGSFVYTWNPFTFLRDTFAEYHEEDSATSVKWHPDGKNIVLGSHSGSIKVCDVALKKTTVDGDCLCEKDGFACSITTLAWHPVQCFGLAMGCTRGMVTALDLGNCSKGTLTVIGHQRVFFGNIATLRFSPSHGQIGKFLAVGGCSEYVYILLWPTLVSHLKIQLASPCRALAWHPWRPSLLAIGIGAGAGSIHLMNVMTEKLIQSYQPPVACSSCCLEWCPKSGLLISSHIIPPNNTKILVLSSFNRVEQKMEGKFGRILYLMWSPDGSQIATAGSDETLRIWSLSHNSFKNTSEKGRRKEKKALLKEVATPLNFSKFIR